MKSRGAIVSRIKTFLREFISFYHRVLFCISNLVHEKLDDHDDPLEPLDNLQHLLLVDLLLEEDHSDRVDLEDDLLKPELIRLMGNDEQMLIVNLRA